MRWQNDFDDLSLDNVERDRFDTGTLYIHQKHSPINWDAIKYRFAFDADRERRIRVYMGWDPDGVWTKHPNPWLP